MSTLEEVKQSVIDGLSRENERLRAQVGKSPLEIFLIPHEPPLQRELGIKIAPIAPTYGKEYKIEILSPGQLQYVAERVVSAAREGVRNLVVTFDNVRVGVSRIRSLPVKPEPRTTLGKLARDLELEDDTGGLRSLNLKIGRVISDDSCR